MRKKIGPKPSVGLPPKKAMGTGGGAQVMPLRTPAPSRSPVPGATAVKKTRAKVVRAGASGAGKPAHIRTPTRKPR